MYANNASSEFVLSEEACNSTTAVSFITDPLSGSALSVGLVALMLTLLLQLLVPKLHQRTSDKLFFHYCFSQCLLLAAALVRHVAPVTAYSCSGFAGCIYYMFLVNFAWSVAQAVHLYRQIVLVYEDHIPHFVLKATLASYGTAAVLMLVTFAADSFRMSWLELAQIACHRYCRFEVTAGVLVGFFIPIVLIFIFNTYVFLHVMLVAFRHSTEVRESRTYAERLYFGRMAFTTFMLLGLTWIVGLVSIVLESESVDTVFHVILSFSGIFIFISKGLLSKPVKGEVQRRSEQVLLAVRSLSSSSI